MVWDFNDGLHGIIVKDKIKIDLKPLIFDLVFSNFLEFSYNKY
jgi:hypothetical protein